MAEVTPTNLRIRSEYAVMAHQWVVDALSECAPLEIPLGAKVTVQVDGNLDHGDVGILGSLDGKYFHQLLDTYGSNANFSAEGMKTIGQAVRFIKPDPTLGEKASAIITVVTGA